MDKCRLILTHIPKAFACIPCFYQRAPINQYHIDTTFDGVSDHIFHLK